MENIISGLSSYSYDSTENWETNNPIIPNNVLCIENTGSELKIKIGNGVNPWNTLPYWLNVVSDNQATETELGMVRRATLTEALEGIDPEKYISPDKLLSVLEAKEIELSGFNTILTPGSTIFKRVDTKVNFTNTTYDDLLPYGSAATVSNGTIPFCAFRMEHKGTVTMSIDVKRGTGTVTFRFCKNLEVLREQVQTRNKWNTFTYNVDIIPGDILSFQTRNTNIASRNGDARNVRILIGQPV